MQQLQVAHFFYAFLEDEFFCCIIHSIVLRSTYNIFTRVVDLGVMVPCETILQSVAKEKVETVLALSGKVSQKDKTDELKILI